MSKKIHLNICYSSEMHERYVLRVPNLTKHARSISWGPCEHGLPSYYAKRTKRFHRCFFGCDRPIGTYQAKMNVGGIVKRAFPESRIVSIYRIPKGSVNHTYDITISKPDKQLILRLFPQDGWKAEKDRFIYNLIAKKTDVKVPEVYALRASRPAYSLLSKIPGSELGHSASKPIKEAGAILAKIHSIKFPKFGWIIGSTIKPSFGSWLEFSIYDFNHKIRNLRMKVSKKLLQEAQMYFKEHQSLLDIRTKPCLIHKDFHNSHILVDHGRVSCVIDVEWAMSGHNELDLAKSLWWMFSGNSRMEAIFMSGYLQHGRVSADFQERRKLYELMIALSSCLFSYEQRNFKWLSHNLKKVRSIVT